MQINAFSPATRLLSALRARDVSAVELLNLHLDRISRYNPGLNAIVIQDYNNARRAAEAADAARARGEDAPLLGLPVTIKDYLDARGLPSTAGEPERAGVVPENDAPLTARVRAAGAVIMGKTNVPPMTRGSDWQSVNPVFGRTNNPWDSKRTPGGSTGGGAAAVAAGLTPLEFGSDIGGSIRVPAAFCGIYGHKPSETAVPRSGHVPYTPDPAMLVQGPLARGAADLNLAMDVIAGPEPGEDAGWRLELPPPRHERLADFRVGVLPPIDWLPVDGEILAALDETAARLRRSGATVQAAAPEGFDARDHHLHYTSLLNLMLFMDRTPEQRERIAARMRGTGDEFAEAAVQGVMASAGDYFRLLAERERYRAMYRAFFREWDVLLAPITIVPAFPHTDQPVSRRTLTVDSRQVPYLRQTVYPGIATFPGLPATAFPAGLTRTGLPIGLQAIGPYLEDRTPLRFAQLLDHELGGFRPPPGYDAE